MDIYYLALEMQGIGCSELNRLYEKDGLFGYLNRLSFFLSSGSYLDWAMKTFVQIIFV